MHRGAWQASVHGLARDGHNLVTKPPPPPPHLKIQVSIIHGINRIKE